jgi:hypothetical protein
MHDEKFLGSLANGLIGLLVLAQCRGVIVAENNVSNTQKHIHRALKLQFKSTFFTLGCYVNTFSNKRPAQKKGERA